MKIYLKNNKYFFVFIVLLSTYTLNAQLKKTFKIIDNESNLPISQVTFIYGEQSGISNKNGEITFRFQENTVMKISHLSYGTQKIDSEFIIKTLKDGKLYLTKNTTELQPATIIALRSKQNDKELLSLQYQDKMEHDGGALLNNIPAISSIRKSGNYGFDPVIRGFKYDQLNVVINGVQSAKAACPNRMDTPTSQIPVNMVDRVEILKGPYSLRYGSVIGGTINFISSPLNTSEDFSTYARVSSGFESNGDISRNEGVLGFSHKKYSTTFFGSWSEGNDYEDGNNIDIPSGFNRGSFGVDFGVLITDRQEIKISATRNVARNVDFPALPMDLLEDDTWLFNVTHKINIENKNLHLWKTTAYGTFVDHLMGNERRNQNSRMVNASTEAKTYTYGARTEGIWNFSNTSKIYIGADIRIDKAEGTRTREFIAGPNTGNIFFDNAWQNSSIIKTGFFAESQWKYKQWKIIASGRINVNDASIDEPQNEFSTVFNDTNTTQINPSISLGVVKKLGNSFSMGLWLARAQRSGSITERYINFFPVGLDRFEMLGNPDLDPEINNQMDLTFDYKTKNTALTLNVYASYVDDFISSLVDESLTPRLPNSPGVRRYINIDNALLSGFELNWQQQFLPELQHQFSVAYTYGEDKERDEALPEIPPLDMRYTIKGNLMNNKLHPEIMLRHVLKQTRISNEFAEVETPAFTTLDMSIKYRINPTISASVIAQNLLDEAYFEHLNRAFRSDQTQRIFAPGRNIIVSVNLDFL